MMKHEAKTALSIAAALLIAAAFFGGCSSPSGNGEENYHTVAFDAAGGTPRPQSQSVTDGGKAAAPSPAPVKDGYVLEGWYSDAAYTTRWDFAAATVTADITLYARWTAATVSAENKAALQDAGEITLTAKDQGGADVPLALEVGEDTVTLTVGGGDPVEYPVVITDSAIILKGAGDGATDVPLDYVINDNGTLTITGGLDKLADANLSAGPVTSQENENLVKPDPSFTVSFNAQGGVPAPQPQTVTRGGKAAAPSPAPVREGYVLEGWHADASYTTPWNFAVNTVTADTTLYAKWTALAVVYTVAFDPQGGAPKPADQSVTSGQNAAGPSPVPVNAGYTLEGWYKEASYTTKWNFDDPVTADLTLHAKWEAVAPDSFVVAFDSRGGGAVASQTIANNGTVEEPDAPERSGYVFDGWHKEAAGTTPWDFADDTVTADITLYAKWTAVWTVTFNSQQGGAVAPIEGVTNGSLIAKPGTDPVRTGYRFDGWHREAAETTPWDFAKDTVTANITLYAKWTALYNVTFDSRDGSAVAGLSNVPGGSVIAKPADPTLANCSFAGWHKEAAGTTPWNFATDTVAANTTLYAKWTVTVSFDANGGTEAPAAQTLARGSLITVPADPVFAGKTFAGWYKEAAGTNLWSLATDTVAANITLYAKWTVVAVTGIRNVPADGLIGEALDLSAAAVEPANASLKTIVWTLKDAGTTGVAGAAPFTPSAKGTLKLTATVTNGGAAGDYTQDFDIIITRIRKVTGLDGIASLTGLAQGYAVDLNSVAVVPPNATNKTIVWTVVNAGAGVTAIPGDKKLVLTAAGTLTLRATITNGNEDDAGDLSDYTDTFSFTVDKTSVPGGVGVGDAAAIELYANGDTAHPLPADRAIKVPRNTEYYISIDGAYTSVVWRLNGNPSTVSGGKLYLDTTRAGTVTLTVTAEKSGVVNDGVCVFIIE